jgi:hypothetical protein
MANPNTQEPYATRKADGSMFDNFFGNIGTAIGSMFVADPNTPAGATLTN